MLSKVGSVGVYALSGTLVATAFGLLCRSAGFYPSAPALVATFIIGCVGAFVAIRARQRVRGAKP